MTARLELTKWASYLATSIAAIAGLAMLSLFLVQSAAIWKHSGFGYLTGLEWFYRNQLFGVLPMVYGTLAVSAVALVMAGPLALGTALFTSEVLPERWRVPVKAMVEVLAGVPSVVFGLLGVLVLRSWVYGLLEPFEPLSGDTLLTGGLLLAVMILPTLTTLFDDALRGVAASRRRAARSLGLTRAETICSVSLPDAWPSLVAAALLGLGRALGETIAVFLVIGRRDNAWPESLLSFRPLAESGQTLTTKLGGSEVFIAYGDPVHWSAMIGLALVLLALVLSSTLISGALARWRRLRA